MITRLPRRHACRNHRVTAIPAANLARAGAAAGLSGPVVVVVAAAASQAAAAAASQRLAVKRVAKAVKAKAGPRARETSRAIRRTRENKACGIA